MRGSASTIDPAGGPGPCRGRTLIRPSRPPSPAGRREPEVEEEGIVRTPCRLQGGRKWRRIARDHETVDRYPSDPPRSRMSTGRRLALRRPGHEPGRARPPRPDRKAGPAGDRGRPPRRRSPWSRTPPRARPSSASTCPRPLQVHALPGGEAFSVPNAPEGHADLAERLAPLGVTLAVLEATGGLEAAAAAALAAPASPSRSSTRARPATSPRRSAGWPRPTASTRGSWPTSPRP